MIPYTKDSFQLLHDGARALSIVESNGIRIDEEYLDNAIRRTSRKIKKLQREQRDGEVYEIWKNTFGRKTNLESNDQLATVLFEKLGHEPTATTAKGKPKTDEKALSAVDEPFVKNYLKIKKLQKALSTYLKGIKKEVVYGFLHPSFNLHTTQTFRSSSSNPNFQNFPIRNPVIGKLIRSSFIPRKGNRLVELDYGAIEVRAAACYHKDPNMLTYIKDPTKDMHRDMAMECYKLPQDQVTKPIRYCGKNMFVFPQFYGDWYLSCCKSLWEAMSTMDLKTTDGTPLQEHLRSKGIRELGDCDPDEEPDSGTFEKHIKEVEKHFWTKRFPVYTKWKRKWVDKYRRQGWMLTKSGFICQGFMRKNEIINYPVQGSAFHCLLKALIDLQDELIRRGMKSKIVGQIHDSIVADVPDEEIQQFLNLAEWIMTINLRKQWGWIIVPLEAEAEVTPVNGSWFEKAEWVKTNGKWAKKKKENLSLFSFYIFFFSLCSKKKVIIIIINLYYLLIIILYINYILYILLIC